MKEGRDGETPKIFLAQAEGKPEHLRPAKPDVLRRDFHRNLPGRRCVLFLLEPKTKPCAGFAGRDGDFRFPDRAGHFPDLQRALLASGDRTFRKLAG